MENVMFPHQKIKTIKYNTMETKKSYRANLENKKGIFLQIGFIVALALSLLAFEWKTPEKNMTAMNAVQWDDVEVLLPVNTVQPKPLPPPPAPKPVLIIKEVGNEDPVDDFTTINVEIDPDGYVPDIFQLSDEPVDTTEDEIFRIVEEMPAFPGGETAMYRYLGNNIQYPRAAVEANITGTVYVSFIVEKDGSLGSIKAERFPHQLLAEEAVRVISEMPAWNPGKQRGKPVRVSYNIPIKFSLQ